MKLLLSYLKNYRGALITALLLATVNQGFSLLDPQIFRLIVDRFASKATTIPLPDFISGVLFLLGISVGVAFISRVAKNFQDYFVSIVTQRVGAAIYAESVEHSFSLPFSAFEDQRSGELLKKLERARADAQGLITNFVNVVFLSFIGIAFVLIYAFTVHWSIGLAYFLIIPILGTATFLIGRKIKEHQKRIVSVSVGLAGSTTETLRNVELVKSLGLEAQEIARLNSVNDTILNLELKKIKLIRVLGFIQGTMVNAVRSLLLFLMLYLIASNIISLGEFFSLFIYSFFIFTPLSELGAVSAQYQETRASMEKLEEILNMPRATEPDSPKPVGRLETIEFKKVSFMYSVLGMASLDNVDFSIKAGETVAFVGPSGAGKSTIMKLLVGLYAPTGGTVSVNGIPREEINFTEFRKRIGLVLQETQLFAGTIKENLLFANPSASDDDCMRALSLASALTIVTRGGQGLETRIGEGGMKLSGGERQRLAIARALLRNPDLIIFDEATSSLDSLTEREITKTIQQIETSNPNLITVLVAHRLSTIAHADKIFVLEKGSVVERGTHADLLKNGNLYAALWREQSGEQ